MSFCVQILGSGSAIPLTHRYTSSQALICNGIPYLIDCGEAAQMRMREFSVPFTRTNNIFISHIHGDHIFGLFGLLSTLSMLGRKNDL
ncbi:MAG: ribonuclease Z, partial [Bacteroidales bacterium]|nr:ribonuclease Z [Bacteroidales bacterium]